MLNQVQHDEWVIILLPQELLSTLCAVAYSPRPLYPGAKNAYSASEAPIHDDL
ncbi:hypothetical protein [Sphingobium algorifonticola]|uniref:hypothetical protein n=1 Tax=Sphingobium algorifonticola TaxID=2008318 RepID=UPI0013E32145|nr:hypothetical protein [Sphingobium algorifonticola]